VCNLGSQRQMLPQEFGEPRPPEPSRACRDSAIPSRYHGPRARTAEDCGSSPVARSIGILTENLDHLASTRAVEP